ncbi:DNA-binding protein [Natronomonas sp. EA1]|uniref:DNA-binding protein n=1 Tax=Natronomonas sp. EA1 TaxID=3421655 RepID=UPI003EC05529
MSGQPNEDELEELRKKKMQQLQDKQGGQADEEAMEAQRQKQEAQKKALLRQALTDSARKRLNSVRMSKPQFAEQVEQQVVALAQSGRLQGQIDDDQMRSLLKELQPDKTEFNIERR